MGKSMFRPLKAEEIECRIDSIQQGRGRSEGKVYVRLLLYKDARCDQRILDETVGPMGWQRRHAEHNGNLFCAIGIKDPQSGEWIWKEDAGAESNYQAEKGHASDSFKRAATNWGIGRELYTAPIIGFELEEQEYYTKNGKMTSNAKFHVLEIEYRGGEICKISIADRHDRLRFSKQV